MSMNLSFKSTEKQGVENSKYKEGIDSLETVDSVSSRLFKFQEFYQIQSNHLESVFLTVSNDYLLIKGKEERVFLTDDILGAIVKKVIIPKNIENKTAIEMKDESMYKLKVYFLTKKFKKADSFAESAFKRKHQVNEFSDLNQR